jgi:hypothetical protein
MPRCVKVTLVFAAFVMLLPAAALAQRGQIAGTVRTPGSRHPGVTAEVTSPALIEKVRRRRRTGGQYRSPTRQSAPIP